MQSYHHAIIPSCKHTIMQSCYHAIMQSCHHAIMDASLAYLALFSRCPILRTPKENHFINTIAIEEVKICQFLGVVFDNKLLQSPYIKYLRSSIEYKIHLLRRLSITQKRKFPKLIMFLFRSLVYPVFEYGSICFLNMYNTTWQNLNSMHHQALRAFFNIPQYLPYTVACNICFTDDFKSIIISSAKTLVFLLFYFFSSVFAYGRNAGLMLNSFFQEE